MNSVSVFERWLLVTDDWSPEWSNGLFLMDFCLTFELFFDGFWLTIVNFDGFFMDFDGFWLIIVSFDGFW